MLAIYEARLEPGDDDSKGDLYEYLLSKVVTAGTNGQFRILLRIDAMNMLLHGVDNPNISYRDSLSEQNADIEKYSLVLANPPFKGSLDYEAVSADLLKVTKTKKTFGGV